jgi:hypothetical protein
MSWLHFRVFIVKIMFSKGNFEGEYRSRPTVSIRGATRGESKEELLHRAHQERAAREVSSRGALSRSMGNISTCYTSIEHFFGHVLQ